MTPSHPTSSTTLLAALVVLLAALAIRAIPFTSESFAHDPVTQQLAAREGVRANAWDEPPAYEHRMFHPPLLSYLIAINHATVGEGAYRSRVFSMGFGALACALTCLAVILLLPSGVAGTIAGLAAGLLLAFLPVHLYVSRTANWDAVFSALVMACLLASSLFLRTPRRSTLVIAALAFVLAVLTSELGLALLAPLALTAAFDWRRRGNAATRDWLIAALVAFAVVTVLWPAGILKLDLLRTLRFRYFDSVDAVRNQHWFAFYTDLFRQSPEFVLAVGGGLLALALATLRARATMSPEGRVLVPFLAYVALGVLISTRQRLVYVHHIVDMMAPLAVLAAMGYALAVAQHGRRLRRAAAVAVGVVALAGGIVRMNGLPGEVVGPQEHPGLLGVAAFLERHPAATTWFYHAGLMAYYAPGHEVSGGPRIKWSENEAHRARAQRVDFVVVDWTSLDAMFSDWRAIAATLAPDFERVETVHHRRTGDEVAWIFARRER